MGEGLHIKRSALMCLLARGFCRRGKFEDELTRTLKHTGAGILSMANAGPNTNGSQFFITLAPTPWLDGKHTIFGRVSVGMEVVRRLNTVMCDANDRPTEKVEIFRAYPGQIQKHAGGPLMIKS